MGNSAAFGSLYRASAAASYYSVSFVVYFEKFAALLLSSLGSYTCYTIWLGLTLLLLLEPYPYTGGTEIINTGPSISMTKYYIAVFGLPCTIDLHTPLAQRVMNPG